VWLQAAKFFHIILYVKKSAAKVVIFRDTHNLFVLNQTKNPLCSAYAARSHRSRATRVHRLPHAPAANEMRAETVCCTAPPA